MNESVFRHLEQCPFCGNKKVEIRHHVPKFGVGKKESWSFHHRCRKRAEFPGEIVITGENYPSAAAAEEAWKRGCIGLPTYIKQNT